MLDFNFLSSLESQRRNDVLHMRSNSLGGMLFLVEGFSSAGIWIACGTYL